MGPRGIQDHLPTSRSLTSPHLQSPFCHEGNTFTGPRSQGVALSGGHCSADRTHVQRFTFQTGKAPMATPIALAMPWQQLSGGSAVDTIYPNYLKIDLLSYQFFPSLLSPPQCKQHPSAWATALAWLCSPLKLHSTQQQRHLKRVNQITAFTASTLQ